MGKHPDGGLVLTGSSTGQVLTREIQLALPNSRITATGVTHNVRFARPPPDLDLGISTFLQSKLFLFLSLRSVAPRCMYHQHLLFRKCPLSLHQAGRPLTSLFNNRRKLHLPVVSWAPIYSSHGE